MIVWEKKSQKGGAGWDGQAQPLKSLHVYLHMSLDHGAFIYLAIFEGLIQFQGASGKLFPQIKGTLHRPVTSQNSRFFRG